MMRQIEGTFFKKKNTLTDGEKIDRVQMQIKHYTDRNQAKD